MTLKQIILDTLYDDYPNPHGQRELYNVWEKHVGRFIFGDEVQATVDSIRHVLNELGGERAIVYMINRLQGVAGLGTKKWMGYRLTTNQWLKMTRQKQLAR